ncbi:MAG: acetate/propionate family kinase [Firmicutes bacterium]|nr:acetate/propionate family kinase [Alicyclobacillaceae bacterium]MCL6498252.1 acetate/propionate family kinase [Bacillota bacterium]
MTTRRILAVNGGSSSLKFGLFAVSADAEKALWMGAIEGIGAASARWWCQSGYGERTEGQGPVADAEAAVHRLVALLAAASSEPPDAIGHRLVTGGPELSLPVLIDDTVRLRLNRAVPYAPLHLPYGLAVIDALVRQFPTRPHVACFDTTFHRTLPERAWRLPLPRSLAAQGIRRYGFHGLSYESIVDQLKPDLPPRLVIAHLGSGCSVAAVYHGVSVDTTMGLTPTGGVVMATRPGDLDPGVLLFLLQQGGYGLTRLEALLNHESGLYGLSGITGDMAALLAQRQAYEPAQQAVASFVYSVQKAIAAMTVALGGFDTLVFTGGIGEHAPAVRQAVAEGLAHLGVELDDTANRLGGPVLSARSSRVVVRVLPAQEERMIARHAAAVLDAARPESQSAH